MKSFAWLYKFLAVILAVQLAGCSATGSDKGSRSAENEIVLLSSNSGFGGTGRTQTDESAGQIALLEGHSGQAHSMQLDSGFGGTGRTSKGFGGTGIIGTIEKFGSIWVNGIEIGLGEKTRIHSNLPGNSDNLKASDLRLGQQVWLETHADQDNTTTADIHIYYPLAGKIETMQTQAMATEIMVNGQRVYVNESTRLGGNVQLKVGEFVRISGLPVYRQDSRERENAWQATLVESEKRGMTWLKTHPDVTFSGQVNRVVMQDNWLTAYRAGEFAQIPAGLSSQPKIKMEGQGNKQADDSSSAAPGISVPVDKSSGMIRPSVRSLQSVRPGGLSGLGQAASGRMASGGR